jgi:hypothetical protein
VTIKIWDDQGVEEDSRRLDKARFVEQEVEKMSVELKEVIEKATKRKGSNSQVKQKEQERKMSEQCEQCRRQQ